MTIDILVPQIGEAVSELTLVNWLKAAGDAVEVGDVLFEIDSDKAIVEVEAYVAGTLIEIMQPAGSAVMPQQVVGRLQPVAETASVPVTTNGHDRPQPARAERKASPVAQRMASELGVTLDQVRGSGPGGRITVDDVRRLAEKPLAPPLNASPKARLLAKERGIDLTGLTGTGVDGMVIVRDVVAAPVAESAAVPLTKLRRVIAARTQASKQTIPHFYLMVDVDMTQANALRAYCHDRAGWPRPPTYTDILIRVCALTLAEMPEYNRSYSETGLSVRDRVGVGVAVSTDDGLVVPVIPEANRLSLAQVSAALRELAARARAGRLRPDDLGEKSLVISNLGMYSVDAFIAIIDMPDPMILAVGQVADRVVPVAGQVAIRPMCTLSLSVDHRVFDGVQGARFLERIKDRLENPFDLMG